jgi:hypothetical protein
MFLKDFQKYIKKYNGGRENTFDPKKISKNIIVIVATYRHSDVFGDVTLEEKPMVIRCSFSSRGKAICSS